MDKISEFKSIERIRGIILDQNKLRKIKTVQDIPSYFEDMGKLKGTIAVFTGLEIARELNLIPKDSDLRRLWYAFFKIILQNNFRIIQFT